MWSREGSVERERERRGRERERLTTEMSCGCKGLIARTRLASSPLTLKHLSSKVVALSPTGKLITASSLLSVMLLLPPLEVEGRSLAAFSNLLTSVDFSSRATSNE